MQFDYYYGTESEQFSFYKLPKFLMKEEQFKGLSNDANLLYAFMLDRISLSRKNEWLDEKIEYILFINDARVRLSLWLFCSYR